MGHQWLGSGVDLGVLVGEPQRRRWPVNKAGLIGKHLGGRSAASVARRRGYECLLRRPPQLCDAIVRPFHATGRGPRLAGRIIDAMRLGVAQYVQPDLVKRHERAVFVTPDAVELFQRQLRLATEQVHESNHVRHYAGPIPAVRLG
jgi:hypothetical protein